MFLDWVLKCCFLNHLLDHQGRRKWLFQQTFTLFRHCSLQIAASSHNCSFWWLWISSFAIPCLPQWSLFSAACFDHLDNLKLQSLKNIAYDDCLLLGSWTLEVFSENLPRDMFWRMEWKSWATELADCCCCFCCQLVDDQAACSCCCSVLCFARGMLFFLQSVPQWSWYYLVSSGIRHHECSSACKALQ